MQVLADVWFPTPRINYYLEEVNIFYFMSESLLEELPSINHFISKSILTKSILFRINSIKVEPNRLLEIELL